MICYELNEVPWRVLDYYIEQRPQSFFAKNIDRFTQLTTVTRDSGELHPWSTWPTMHRGVNNDCHDIRYINQDLSGTKAYPPVWEILARSGVSVGVFGSLQSYPLFKNENVAFYLPDTFSPDEAAYPKSIVPFQKFNLKMAGKNKATTSRLSFVDFLQAPRLLMAGVGVGSLIKAGQHLLSERLDSKNKSLRPAMQAHLAFDVFWKLLNCHRPQFATFFTNHVASLMHRYWMYTFPEDFSSQPPRDNFFEFHKQTILKGMDIVDKQLEQISAFSEDFGYELIISSSMGQEAIDRGEYIPELQLTTIKFLTQMFECKEPVKLNPAMQPDVAFEFRSKSSFDHFKNESQELLGPDGEKILRLRYTPKGLTLNLSIQSSHAIAKSGQLSYRGKTHPVEDFGFKVFRRDPGTGYHVPEGIWLWRGNHKLPKLEPRQRVDSCTYLPAILTYFNLPIPSYSEAGQWPLDKNSLHTEHFIETKH
jgi:hypothetical protein